MRVGLGPLVGTSEGDIYQKWLTLPRSIKPAQNIHLIHNLEGIVCHGASKRVSLSYNKFFLFFFPTSLVLLLANVLIVQFGRLLIFNLNWHFTAAVLGL